MANTELMPLELQSLRSLSTGHKIEMHMLKALLDRGLIAEKLGGWVLTDLGEWCLAHSK